MTNPTVSQEASDVFSFSDDVLADRLEFIEEAGSCTSKVLFSSAQRDLRLALAIGAACGTVDRAYALPWRNKSSNRRLPSSSCIDPRRTPLLHASSRCKFSTRLLLRFGI
jgi:hypothetical protein